MRLFEIMNWAIGANRKHSEHPTRQERGNVIVWLNAKEVLPLVDPNFRVSPDDEKNQIGNRLEKAIAHFKKEGWMDPPDVYFNEYNPKYPVDFGNGRHRVAAALKLGDEWFPASVPKRDVEKLASKLTVKKTKP